MPTPTDKQEERRQTEVHSTERGYCCACGYDIAGFEQDKALALHQGALKCLETLKKTWCGECLTLSTGSWNTDKTDYSCDDCLHSKPAMRCDCVAAVQRVVDDLAQPKV